MHTRPPPGKPAARRDRNRMIVARYRRSLQARHSVASRWRHAPFLPAMARAFSPYSDSLTTLYLGRYPRLVWSEPLVLPLRQYHSCRIRRNGSHPCDHKFNGALLCNLNCGLLTDPSAKGANHTSVVQRPTKRSPPHHLTQSKGWRPGLLRQSFRGFRSATAQNL